MTFDPFGDFAQRGYLRNAGGLHDPRQVKELEHAYFLRTVGEAVNALRGVRTLTYQHVLDTHRTLFQAVYPWAGQDRLLTAPELAIGKGGRFDLFASPEDVQRAAEHALNLGRNKETMRARPGEVWGFLAYAHPFLEGNGRTIMIVHGELCRRAGLHIDWRNVRKDEWLAALTEELDEPGRKLLDTFLAPYVKLKPVSAVQEAEVLRSLPGLGPAATGCRPDCTPAPEQSQAPSTAWTAGMQTTAPERSGPLVPRREVPALDRNRLEDAILADAAVIGARRDLLARALDVYVDRAAAVTAILAHIIEHRSDPTTTRLAVIADPGAFGDVKGKYRRLAGHDADRVKALDAVPTLAEAVTKVAEARSRAEHRIVAAHDALTRREAIEVPAPSPALTDVLEGRTGVTSLPEAIRADLFSEARALKRTVEARFLPAEREALAKGDLSPLRARGVREDLAVAGTLTKVLRVRDSLRPERAREQARSRSEDGGLGR